MIFDDAQKEFMLDDFIKKLFMELLKKQQF